MSNKTKAHCNRCGGERNHDILHSVTTSWKDDEMPMWGSDCYETLQCCGCEEIKLRHTSEFSENEHPSVHYFPPSIFRKPPSWYNDLWIELPSEEDFVEALLKEIYIALQNNRKLPEKVDMSKIEISGTMPIPGGSDEKDTFYREPNHRHSQ